MAYRVIVRLARRSHTGLPPWKPCPGSYLSINDGSRGIDPVFEQAQDAYNNSGAVPYNLRSIDEITAFFDGLELVEPSVVPVTQGRPEPGSDVPEVIAEHGGLARKP